MTVSELRDTIFFFMDNKSFDDKNMIFNNYLIKNNIVNAKKFKRYSFLINLMDWFIGLKLESQKTDILFLGTKFNNILLGLHPQVKVKVIVKWKSERMFCVKNKVPYISANRCLYLLIKSYLSSSEKNANQRLLKAYEEAKRILSENKPKIVIVWNQADALERLIILTAKELGIPTMYIQDGIFQKKWLSEFRTGFCDYIAVWGKYFKKLFVEEGIDEERIFILGYPNLFDLNTSHVLSNNSMPLKVCFLGQDLENYFYNLLSTKNLVIKNISNACKDLGIHFAYRPHPNENHQELVKEIGISEIIPASISLSKVFEENNIFFSFNSTALIEASMRGKICVQIITQEIASDNFEELGISFSLENDYLKIKEFLIKIISKEKSPSDFNPDYVDVKSCPTSKLKSFLEQITNMQI